MSAGAAKPFPHLFSPLPLGRRQARNRVFRAATATNLAEKFDVSDRLLAHYATLARGGAGVIVTEAMRMHPSAVVRGSNIPGFDPKIIPGLTRWAEAVHAAGALLIGQINHSGREHNSTTVPARLIGPSAIACPRSGGVPRAMGDDEIEDFIKHAVPPAGTWRRRASTASRCIARRATCCSSSCRRSRTSAPTVGAAAGRTASASLREILSGIRASTPSDFIVGMRLGVDEFTDGGWTLEMSARLVGQLVERRADRLRLAVARQFQHHRHAPAGPALPQVPFRDLHAKLKAAVPAATVDRGDAHRDAGRRPKR